MCEIKRGLVGKVVKEQSEVAEHHFDNFPLATGLRSCTQATSRHTLYHQNDIPQSRQDVGTTHAQCARMSISCGRSGLLKYDLGAGQS